MSRLLPFLCIINFGFYFKSGDKFNLLAGTLCGLVATLKRFEERNENEDKNDHKE